MHGVPATARVTLALAIPEDRLDRAARAAVSDACGERGLAATGVARAVLRPMVEGGVARLIVEELALDRLGGR